MKFVKIVILIRIVDEMRFHKGRSHLFTNIRFIKRHLSRLHPLSDNTHRRVNNSSSRLHKPTTSA